MIKTTKILLGAVLISGALSAQNPVINSSNAICAGQSTNLSVNDFLNKGLVAYYPFNGNTNDMSGNLHNATPTGVTPALDRFGNAGMCYEFAGTGTYIQCPPAVYFNGDYTISGWVNITNAESWSRLIDFGNGPSNNNVLVSLNAGGSGMINASVYNGGSGSGFSSIDPLMLNQWVQITVTNVGNTVLLYVNGVPVYQNTGGMYVPNNVTRNNNYIGLSNWGSDGGVYGRMDDIRIYGRGLSIAEVAQLYNYENTAESEATYSWSNGGSGTVITVAPSATTTYSVTETRNGVANTGSIVVTAGLADEPVTTSVSTLICSGNGTVSTGTEEGVNYYLRNDVNDTIIAGPVKGTGSTVTFNTGNITANTTYNVYGVKPSGGLELNGSDYAVISAATGINSLFGSNQLTAEGWFYPTVSTSYPMLIGESYLGDDNVQFSLYQDGTNIYGGFYNSGWHQISAPITLNTWQHIACTYDQSELKLYINGALISSAPETAPLPLGTEEWRIGLRWDLPDHYQGKMDELRVWNTARTQSEIQSAMNTCLTGTEANLVLYYNFEEGTGTTLTDLAGGDQSATLINSDATAWAAGRETCSTCNVEMTVKPTITINPIADQAITNTNLICAGDATISLAGSETGIYYYLRDDSNDSLIAGPVAGTGSALDLTATGLTDTTTYNVYAAKPFYAIEFNSSNYAETPFTGSLQFGTGDFTIEYWTKTPNAYTMVAVGGTGGSDNYWMGIANGVASVSISGSATLQGTTNIADQQWHHVAAVRNSGTFMIYVDGNMENSETNTNSASPNGTLAIGAFGGVGYNYAGTLDEVKIWNIARSPSEVQGDMTGCLTGTESGLSAYYKFEDVNNAPVLTDLAGEDNNATLYNMNPSDWVIGTFVCNACAMELTTKPTVLVTPILDYPASASASDVCLGSNATITIPSSQVGVEYYLQSNAQGNIEGPIAGTGSSISFTATNIQNGTETYTVLGQKPDGSCGSDMTNPINFTVHTPAVTNQNITLCAGETLTVGTSTYSTSGTYQDVVAGFICDSTINTVLTINNPVDNSTFIDGQGYITANLQNAVSYSWIDCNDATPSELANTISYLPTVNGDYAVIIDDNGCVDTSACVPYYSTGINENASANSFKIYPNPNAGEFIIQAAAAGTYSIVNELGQLVQTVSLNAGTDFKCSVSGLKNGVYFLSGIVEGHVIKQKIVVVN